VFQARAFLVVNSGVAKNFSRRPLGKTEGRWLMLIRRVQIMAGRIGNKREKQLFNIKDKS